MSTPQEAAEIFKILSVDTRIRILELLRGRVLCVNALADRLGVTPAAVSQHLRVMRAAGFVIPEKRGYYVHYRLNKETLSRWRKIADELLTAETPETPEALGNSRKEARPCVAEARKARGARSRRS